MNRRTEISRIVSGIHTRRAVKMMWTNIDKFERTTKLADFDSEDVLDLTGEDVN